MKNTFKILGSILFSIILFSSCVKEQFLEPEGNKPAEKIDFSNTIHPLLNNAICQEEELPPMAIKSLAAAAKEQEKSLIDAQTTRHIETQFLRIDETEGTYTYETWDKGYLMIAEVVSSPGNATQNYMRSVLLNPVQSYKIEVVTPDPKNEAITDTTFHHTRLVSWYPVTCSLEKTDGTYAYTQFINFNEASAEKKYILDADNKLKLIFDNLDGKTDVMVSEVREGQHWHHDNRKNYYGPGEGIKKDVPKYDLAPAGSQFPEGTNIYREPFGTNEKNPYYSNCFEYKHYLSAIKVYAYAQDSDQNAAMWGRIKEVKVREQPKKCYVKIPDLTVQDLITEGRPQTRIYGESSFSTNEFTMFSLNKGNIFGNDPNAPDKEVAPNNPTLDGSSQNNKVYLGNALIQPNHDVILDIHTDAGVFSVTIPELQQKEDKNGNKVGEPYHVFNEGYIYNIILNFGTKGTIAAILLDDSDGVYYDLSVGGAYGQKEDVFIYKTANCYMVDPNMKLTADDKKIYLDRDTYDGFTFLANTIGNGDEGLLSEFPQKTTKISPATAGIVWESQLGLVTQVEYMYNYVRFKVQPGTYGNAVIGVYDENSNILWSWHIWITDPVKKYEFELSKNADGQPINIGIMDRNLGATKVEGTSSADILNTYGLYYQWGRKDPFMPPPEYNYRPLSTETSTYYDFYGNKLHSNGVVTLPRPTIQDGIDNPMYIIFPNSLPEFYAFDWLHDMHNSLWGSQEYNQKTIYDPCPFGYRVPGEEFRTLMSKHSGNKKVQNNAFVYTVQDTKNVTQTMVFPLAGYKGVDRGMSSLTASWKYVGTKGDYMTKTIYPSPNLHRGRVYISASKSWRETGADADEDGLGDAFFDYGTDLLTDYANRRTAASVRCVADDFLENLGQIFPYFKGPSIIFLGHPETQYIIGAKSLGSKLTDVSYQEVKRPLLAETGGTPGRSKKVENLNVKNFEFEPLILPGAKSSYDSQNVSEYYDQIGNYIYTVTAHNNKNIENVRSKSVKVINLSQVYDLMIHEVETKTNTEGTAEQVETLYDAVGHDFKTEEKHYLSFKINTRDPLTLDQNFKYQSGTDNTKKDDLDLLFENSQTFVNGVWVGSDMIVTPNEDGTKTITFKTKSPIELTPTMTIECRTTEGMVIKKYKFTGIETFVKAPGYTRYDAIKDNKYYIVTNKADKKIWYHDGLPDNNSLKLESFPKEITSHNVFQVILEPNPPVKERTLYLKLYSKDLYIGEHLGAANPANRYYINYLCGKISHFGPDEIFPEEIKFFRKDGTAELWQIKADRDILKWSYSWENQNGDPFHLHEITPTLKYTKIEDVTPENQTIKP